MLVQSSLRCPSLHHPAFLSVSDQLRLLNWRAIVEHVAIIVFHVNPHDVVFLA
jgi:hypothetical protein